MSQTPIAINGTSKLHFSQIWDGETSLKLTHCLNCEDAYLKIFEKITLFLFIIHSFIELKMSKFPQSFHGSLGQ